MVCPHFSELSYDHLNWSAKSRGRDQGIKKDGQVCGAAQFSAASISSTSTCILACTILYICIIAEREIREHNMVFSIISPTQCEHLEEMTGSWGRDNHGFLTHIQFTLAVRTGHKIQQFLACGADRRACCIHFPITSNSSERYGTAAACFLLHQKMPETGPPDPPDCSSQ